MGLAGLVLIEDDNTASTGLRENGERMISRWYCRISDLTADGEIVISWM